MILDHPYAVEDLCFSSDGKLLATTSDAVRLWSTETGESLGPPLERSGGFWEIAFSPGYTQLVGASQSGTVRAWPLPPPVRGDLPDATLWVEVLTWQELNATGIQKWLDLEAWHSRRAELERRGGAP